MRTYVLGSLELNASQYTDATMDAMSDSLASHIIFTHRHEVSCRRPLHTRSRRTIGHSKGGSDYGTGRRKNIIFSHNAG